ncbi:MAG: DUF262 domain-containing protein [Chryseobacterium sp.]|nr:MAG: DUF262 domain-containing protein [Chryseobacterium sp.]
MFHILVDIGGDEIRTDFTKFNREGGVEWVGDCDIQNGVIKIHENDGTPDERTLLVSTEISTSAAVIFERIINAFRKFRDVIQSGFEPTEESSGQSVKPQPYDPEDIKVRRESFSVFEVNRMMTDQKDIDLNPDFQRNLVWDIARKSALVESILLGIPIPVFYFAESKTGMYHVVDGLQRLSTIKQFFNNEFALKKLEHLSDECNGRYYKNGIDNKGGKAVGLERKYSRRLENAQLIINVIEHASPQKVKYDIFKRLNTGGQLFK